MKTTTYTVTDVTPDQYKIGDTVTLTRHNGNIHIDDWGRSYHLTWTLPNLKRAIEIQRTCVSTDNSAWNAQIDSENNRFQSILHAAQTFLLDTKDKRQNKIIRLMKQQERDGDT